MTYTVYYFIKYAYVCVLATKEAEMPHHVVVDDFLKALSAFLQKLLQNTYKYIHKIIHPAITASQEEAN